MKQIRLPRLHTSILPYLLTLLVLLLAVPPAAQAQEAVPRVEEAEAVFRQALDAFEAGDYGMAQRRFRVVYTAYPLNRKTTAAILMAGKALYRTEDYAGAVDLLDEFIRSYPTSGYLNEAQRTMDLARQQLGGAAPETPLRLGVALPLNDADAGFTQALFNGIRMAVDVHNATATPPVQMIFRDTKNSTSGAREAIQALASEQVDVIIGPLYSQEAEAAAQVAERAGIVLVAPLATDESVSEGRRYVFQANPTIASRGRMMARLVIEDLGLRRFGIAAEEGDTISERMAEGFQEEAYRLGADVVFYDLVPSTRNWTDLPERVGIDILRDVEAVYIPVSGRNAQRSAQEVLQSFERENVLPWVLGNSEWHDVSFKRLATAFSVLYTDDYYVNPSAPVFEFQRDYREIADEEPGRLAYVGHDVATFLMQQMARSQNVPLVEALHQADRFEGLGTRIDFRSGNANQAIFFLEYRNEAIQLRQ